MDAGNWVGVLWRRACRRVLGICEGLVGACFVIKIKLLVMANYDDDSVKMISGALSHVNTGNQFFHFAAIVTFLFLAVTAVFQIICLNRGLKVYDSTLVVRSLWCLHRKWVSRPSIVSTSETVNVFDLFSVS